jgi:hypothetical protein
LVSELSDVDIVPTHVVNSGILAPDYASRSKGTDAMPAGMREIYWKFTDFLHFQAAAT